MRVAVMAAGGLGGYYGAVLDRIGHDVMFIARGAQLEVIRKRGLTIKSVTGDFTIHPAKATDDPAEIGPVDWVLFAVKTYDNPAAIRAIRPLVGEQTAVITFQNGVTSPEELGQVYGMDHVLIAPTQIVSNVVSPGVIVQKSPFRTMFVGEVGGEAVTPRVKQIVVEFQRAGIDADAVPDGLLPMWDKFTFLASLAGLATLARTAPYDLFQHTEAADVLHTALTEVFLVGEAWGIDLPKDTVERWWQFALKLPPGSKPSMQLDLEAGKRLEIDALSGTVVRLGAQKGIPTPVHQTIYAALKREDEKAQVRMAGRG